MSGDTESIDKGIFRVDENLVECCQCGSSFDEDWMRVWNGDDVDVEYICGDCHDDIMNRN